MPVSARASRRHILVALCAAATLAVRPAASAALPGVGESIVDHDIRVTLVGAKRLSVDECRSAFGTDLLLWAGGGVHLAFLVENRPGAPLPPALGEVRVLFGSQVYNEVTNATSGKPFSPFATLRSIDDFEATRYGRELKARIPKPRPDTMAVVLELFIRGGPVPAGAEAIIELEQGETHRPDSQGQLRPVRGGDSQSAWTWFRFRVPSLD